MREFSGSHRSDAKPNDFLRSLLGKVKKLTLESLSRTTKPKESV
jgi:hypothetical protein